MRLPYIKGTFLRYAKENQHDKIEVLSVNQKEKTYQMKCIYYGLCGGEEFYFFVLPFDQIDRFCPIDGLLSPMEKHLVLYTKGHYVTNGRIHDLSMVASKLYSLPVEAIDRQNIFHMVVDVYLKLVHYGYIQEPMYDFLLDLTRWKIEQNIYNTVMDKLLSEIQQVVTTGLQLGEADPTLFPVRKQDKA